MAQLPPVAEPIGVYQNFIAKTTETLILKEKVLSLSGDSFDITNAQGVAFMKIKGRHMTISGRKSVYDMHNNHLYDIVKEHLHIHSTYAAQDPSGKKFLSIKNSIKRTVTSIVIVSRKCMVPLSDLSDADASRQ
jgi:uncharacterized protein YxjI